MPLLDHFRAPLVKRRPWESFNTTWASCLADVLNAGVLPAGYIALEHVHAGANIEIDVAAFDQKAVWMPASAPLVGRLAYTPESTVEIVSEDDGRRLAAAIELVSPANKDRKDKRRLFAAKCATYLARGIGLLVVDVVTTRKTNIHNLLCRLIGWDGPLRMDKAMALYAVAYRPLRNDREEYVELWPMGLAVGAPLPTLPLSLDAECSVPVDLEAAYEEACRRRRVAEALEQSRSPGSP